MRRVFFISVLLLSALLIGSCGSAPPAEEPVPVPATIAPTVSAPATPAPTPAPVVSAPVPAPAPVAPAPAPTPAPVATDPYTRHFSGVILNGAQQYTVQRGDILAGIAWRFYEDGSLYPLILLVSGDLIEDPDIIEPGMVLTIPSLNQNMNDSRARQSLNTLLRQIAQIEEQRGRPGTAALMRSHAN